MRIGVITIHDSTNYGACLQTYALIKYLELEGHHVELIDLRRKEHKDFISSKKYKIDYYHKKYSFRETLSLFDKIDQYARRNIHIFIRKVRNFKLDCKFKKKYEFELSEKNKKFNDFYSKINRTCKYCKVDQLYNAPPEFDVYMVGSDQVWNPYNNYNVEPYFLTFIKKGKKVSYASSMGVSQVNNKYLRYYRDWLSDFDVISVREQAIIPRLGIENKNNVRIDVDPTFLLTKAQWELIIFKGRLIKEKYILLFALTFGDELFDILKTLYKYYPYKLITVVKDSNDYKYVSSNDTKIDYLVNVGVEDWLNLIKNAELVLTDSFHGTVFSMQLCKNYFSYIAENNLKGERIKELLNKFNQDQHLINVNKMTEQDLIVNGHNDFSIFDIEFQKVIDESRQYLGTL